MNPRLACRHQLDCQQRGSRVSPQQRGLKRRSRLALVDAPTVCNRVAEHSADRLTRAALLPCVAPHARSRTTRGATAASRAGSRCTATWTSRRGSSRRRLRRTPRAPAPPGAPSRATARRRRRTRASSPSSTGCASTSASSRCATSVRPTRRGSSPDTSRLAEQAAAATPRTHAPPRLVRPRLTRSCPTSHAARSRVCAVRRVARGGGGAPPRPPPGRAARHAPLASEEWPSASLPAGLSSFLSDEGRTLPPVGLSPPTKAARTRPGCARALAVTTRWLSCGLVCPRLATQARPTRCSTWRCGTSPATAPPSCTTRSRCCTRCCARGPVRQPASLEAPLATSRLRRPRLIRVLPRAAMAHTTAPHGGSCPRLVESPASPASPRVALGRTRSIPQT